MTTPVLICDDSSFARKQMARSIPDGWDVELSFAANGKEAIEAIRAGKADVMFLDLNMPVMDGWEFLNEFIKIKNNLNKKITLYVVSSSIDPRDLERAKSFNLVTDYLIKPIELKKFEKIFDRTAA